MSETHSWVGISASSDVLAVLALLCALYHVSRRCLYLKEIRRTRNGHLLIAEQREGNCGAWLWVGKGGSESRAVFRGRSVAFDTAVT